MEYGFKNQSALNRGVRVYSGCAWSAAMLCTSPSRDGVFIEPERYSTSRYESPIVIGPISNTIPEDIVIFCHEPIVPVQQLLWNSATTPYGSNILIKIKYLFNYTGEYIISQLQPEFDEGIGNK